MKLDDGSVWLVKRERRVDVLGPVHPAAAQALVRARRRQGVGGARLVRGLARQHPARRQPAAGGQRRHQGDRGHDPQRRHRERGARRRVEDQRHAVPQLRHRPVALVARVGQGRGHAQPRGPPRHEGQRRHPRRPRPHQAQHHGRRERQPRAAASTSSFGDSPPAVTCKHKQKLYARQTTQYRWTPWVPGARGPDRRRGRYDFPTDYYLYFEYAKKTVNKKLSAAPRAALLEEMRRGGRVTSITAHTSPEGSHEAQGKAWQGNTKLAEERAAAAEEWVRAVIAEAGNGSIDAKAKVDERRGGRALHAARRAGQGHRGPRPRAALRGDVRHLRRGGPAPPGGRRGAQEGPEERPRAARRPSTSACAAPTSRSRATRAASSTGPRRSRASGATRRVPCNPVSDAEIAKRYPQFTFDG